MLENSFGNKCLNVLHNVLTSSKITKKLLEGDSSSKRSICVVNLGSGTVARVVSHPFSGDQVLQLNSIYFKDERNLRELRDKALKSNWCMPCSKENASTYTIAHEAGHIVHNVLVSKLMKDNAISVWDISSFRKKTLLSFKKKILEHAKKETGLKTQKEIMEKYLSQYGRTNTAEFFAECFANLHSGEPNPLGRAIGKFLDEEF